MFISNSNGSSIIHSLLFFFFSMLHCLFPFVRKKPNETHRRMAPLPPLPPTPSAALLLPLSNSVLKAAGVAQRRRRCRPHCSNTTTNQGDTNEHDGFPFMTGKETNK
jgi:hypothetical protein